MIEGLRERFADQGFVVVPGLFEADRVAELRRGLEAVVEREYGPDCPGGAEVSHYRRPENVLWLVNLRRHSEVVDALATDPSIVTVACALLGSASVTLVEDQFMNKPPGGRGIAYHQDQAYFPIREGDRAISCWVALDDVDAQMGPLRFVPGSHRHGLGEQPEGLHGAGDLRRLLQTACPTLAGPRVVDVVAERGDAVFFDGRLIHGSGANRSPRWRPAFALHFACGTCRYDAAKLACAPEPALFGALEDGAPLEGPLLPRLHA